MEQRPLRLGDIVDDYCPRERRITNHAIVALVGDGIRQTRCTTCDAEHVYKDARMPRRRLKEPALDGKDTDSPLDATEVVIDADVPTGVTAADEPAERRADTIENSLSDASGADSTEGEVAPGADIWPAHRRLIRATLPRGTGEPPPPRPIPEFTMHQRPQGRSWHSGGHGQNRNGHGGPGRDGQGRQPQHAGKPGRRPSRHRRGR
jgi:hypothetical protein